MPSKYPSDRWAQWAGGAAVAVLVLLAVPLRPVRAQDVFIHPDPRHPGHASIHLASLDMDLQVRSGVAAVTLTQVFRNPNPW